MFDYTGLTTAQLIDLLFQRGDQVERRQIEELVGRGAEAAGRMREILRTEDYWYEGQEGDYWIGVHAIVILSAMQDPQALPDLIEMVPHFYFSNHDWAVEVLPAALARFGEPAIEPYLRLITEYRGAYRDNPDYSHCRHDFSAALAMIARNHREQRRRITDFICGIFTDPEEEDEVFLSFSAAHPVYLDRERGMKAVRAAHERGLIKESIVGRFKEFIRLLDRPNSDLYQDLKTDLFDFYHPEAIRDRKRQRAEAREEPLYWGPAAPAGTEGSAASQSGQTVREEKVGRNDPCPCGSGKKYKKCCGAAVAD